jgi:hypothetical protein
MSTMTMDYDMDQAQAVLGGPCKRSYAATDDAHDTGSDGNKRRFLKH